MNVMIAVPSYPDARYPLPGLFHKTQAEALQRQGARVEVVAPIPWIPPGVSALSSNWTRYRAMVHRDSVDGLRVFRPRYIHLPTGDVGGITDITFSRAIATAEVMPPDLIHAHFAYPCGYAAERVAQRRGIPLVLTLHGSDVNVYPHTHRREMQRFQVAVRQASMVIAVSQALAAKTAQMAGLMPLVLPIGIDLGRFDALLPKEECRKQLQFPLDTKIILYAGDLLPAKGIPELLQALHILRQENILGVFVGGGALEALVRTTQNSIALGPRPNTDIPVLMRAADLVVLPSHREGMPTVLIEAGAARTPVLATEVGGIPELLAQDRGFLVPPQQVDALVAGIRHVLFAAGSDAEARALRLHDYVHEHYSVDHSAHTLLGIYRQVIDHHRSTS